MDTKSATDESAKTIPQTIWAIVRRPENWSRLAIWFLVSGLTTGIPATAEAALRKWSSDVFTLGFDNLFAMTAPLILSIAAVSFATRQGMLADAIGPYLAGGIILTGAWIGHWWGHPGAAPAWDLLPTDRHGLVGQVIFAAINQLAGYVRSYGLAASAASLIVGTVLGLAWSCGLEKLSTLTVAAPATHDPAAAEADEKSKRNAA